MADDSTLATMLVLRETVPSTSASLQQGILRHSLRDIIEQFHTGSLTAIRLEQRMKTIARILCLSIFCSVLAGWLGIAIFREYADYLVPASLFAVAGGLVGAVTGAAHEIVLCRTTGITQ